MASMGQQSQMMSTKTTRRVSYNKRTNEFFVGGHNDDDLVYLNWTSRGHGKQTYKPLSHNFPRGSDTYYETDPSILEFEEEYRSIKKSYERKKEEKKNKTKLIDDIKKFNICGIRPNQDINIDSSMKDIKKEFSRLEKLSEQRKQSSLCLSIALDKKQLEKTRVCIKCGCSERHRLLNRDLIKCGCDTCLKDGCVYTLSSSHNGEDILSLFKEISPETFLSLCELLKIEDMIKLQKVSKFFYSEMKDPIKYLNEQLSES